VKKIKINRRILLLLHFFFFFFAGAYLLSWSARAPKQKIPMLVPRRAPLSLSLSLPQKC
jgi:hypothetical protein